jgi:tripartite-type tricarboxylate transporter receptor subunit TctC
MRRIVLIAGMSVIFAWCCVAGAQEKFPSRPIDMIVNFGPGGGADQLGRVASQLLERILGVAVPVSNIVGASGNTGLAKVGSSQPDGYTVGVITGLSISSWAAGMGRLNVNDFAYLGVVQSSPSMLFVVIDSPFKNYQQLLDAAKANPGKLKVATAGFGTLDDFAVKFLAKKGFAMVNAPYAKPAERYTSVLGKHTDVLFEEPGDVAQFLTAKQMRPIVVFGDKRHPEFPDVPASGEYNQHIDLPNWRALITSPSVPKDRVEALNSAIGKMTDTAEWKKFCSETYTCITKMSPADSKKFVQKNYDDAVAFLKESGGDAKK